MQTKIKITVKTERKSIAKLTAKQTSKSNYENRDTVLSLKATTSLYKIHVHV